MLNQTDLLEHLTSLRATNWVNDLCCEFNKQGFRLTDLLDLTLHKNGKIAFHSVWVLDTLVVNNLLHYVNEINSFIKYSQLIKHHSCQRHYARIFMYFTACKNEVVRQKIADTDLEPVVALCFDWLISTKVKVAVKACACEVLFNVSSRYDWVTEELKNQLLILMRNGSPAIQATGRRLLNKLEQDS
jgi:hypothetical protein